MTKFTTDLECIRQREYVGIPAWHIAGHWEKGKVIFCDDVSGNIADCVADIVQGLFQGPWSILMV